MPENPYKAPEAEGVRLAPAWRRIAGLAFYLCAVPLGLIALFYASEGARFLFLHVQRGMGLGVGYAMQLLLVAAGFAALAVGLVWVAGRIRRPRRLID